MHSISLRVFNVGALVRWTPLCLIMIRNCSGDWAHTVCLYLPPSHDASKMFGPTKLCKLIQFLKKKTINLRVKVFITIL